MRAHGPKGVATVILDLREGTFQHGKLAAFLPDSSTPFQCQVAETAAQ